MAIHGVGNHVERLDEFHRLIQQGRAVGPLADGAIAIEAPAVEPDEVEIISIDQAARVFAVVPPTWDLPPAAGGRCFFKGAWFFEDGDGEADFDS